MRDDPFQPWYSLADIGARLGFSLAWVRKRLEAGDFGPRTELFDVSGDIRVPWRNIERFLAAHPAIPSEAMRERASAMTRRKLELRVGREAAVVARNRGELHRKVQTQEGEG